MSAVTVSRSKKICETWHLIQDLIGNAKHWPLKVRKYFWSKNLNNFERLVITAFIFINGLPPNIFFEWCELLKLFHDAQAWRHVKYLLEKFEKINIYDKKVYGCHTGLKRIDTLLP